MATGLEHNCIICAIVARRERASVVREGELTLAFMDINPVNPGHVLVVPKAHAEYLADLAAGVGGSVFEAALEVAAAIRRSGLRCEGINLSLADGEAAGQEVPHVHLHVFPRYRSDGFGLRFAPHYKKPPPGRSELDLAAAMIRGAIDRV